MGRYFRPNQKFIYRGRPSRGFGFANGRKYCVVEGERLDVTGLDLSFEELLNRGRVVSFDHLVPKLSLEEQAKREKKGMGRIDEMNAESLLTQSILERQVVGEEEF